MSEARARVSVLARDQIEQIHHYSLEILSRVGVRVESQAARKVFEKASIKADSENIVRIPADRVDWALEAVPATVDIYNRSGDLVFQMGDIEKNKTRFGVGVTNLYFQSLETDKLAPFSRKHMEVSTRLAQTLESVVALPVFPCLPVLPVRVWVPMTSHCCAQLSKACIRIRG